MFQNEATTILMLRYYISTDGLDRSYKAIGELVDPESAAADGNCQVGVPFGVFAQQKVDFKFFRARSVSKKLTLLNFNLLFSPARSLFSPSPSLLRI